MSFFKMELVKIRRSKLWLPLLVLPALSILFGTANYLGNREVLQREWLSLFTQIYFFYGMLFFPSLVGLVLAFIWHSEHKKNALKLMLVSRYSAMQMLLTKGLLGFVLIFFAQFYLLVLYGLVGSFLGFSTGFPWILIFYTLLGTLFIFPLLACQSYLSLRFKSFALPVAVSMGLGVVGLFMAAQTKIAVLSYVFSFSKIALLLNNLDGLSLAVSLHEWLAMLGWSLLISFVFAVLSLCYLKRIRT